MNYWRNQGKIWCIWPPNPIGIIEVIGGSYLSASPQISYKYLLEGLTQREFAIHAWSYLPSFDHQSQANSAWKSFRDLRKKLEKRVSTSLETIRLGHSLGCKLHLISPDKGRNSCGQIALAFNNFNANRSIPLLSKITSKLNFESEFSPSPKETMNIIFKQYVQPSNLVISFLNDKLDQSENLVNCLNLRDKDLTESIKLKGDHLTPVSTGLRKNILTDLHKDEIKRDNIDDLLSHIVAYSLKKLSP